MPQDLAQCVEGVELDAANLAHRVKHLPQLALGAGTQDGGHCWWWGCVCGRAGRAGRCVGGGWGAGWRLGRWGLCDGVWAARARQAGGWAGQRAGGWPPARAPRPGSAACGGSPSGGRARPPHNNHLHKDTRTPTHTQPLNHAHTHTQSLSLSLSHVNTHTHPPTLPPMAPALDPEMTRGSRLASSSALTIPCGAGRRVCVWGGWGGGGGHRRRAEGACRACSAWQRETCAGSLADLARQARTRWYRRYRRYAVATLWCPPCGRRQRSRPPTGPARCAQTRALTPAGTPSFPPPACLQGGGRKAGQGSAGGRGLPPAGHHAHACHHATKQP